MKGKDLIKMGFKPGPAVGVALLLIPKASAHLNPHQIKRELKAVLGNLDSYLVTLNDGRNPYHRAAGYIHHEPDGVIAIDQKGGGKALAETRLYVYPDTDTCTLYLLLLGDKNSQKRDIQDCREFVASIRKLKEADHDEGQQETVPERRPDDAPSD